MTELHPSGHHSARRSAPSHTRLEQLLTDEAVLCHHFVIGELACGRMRRRTEVLSLLQALPRAHTLDDQEALAFIESHALMGRGLGWIDVHLLASTLLTRASLWTLDKRLAHAADRLDAGGARASRPVAARRAAENVGLGSLPRDRRRRAIGAGRKPGPTGAS